MTTLMKVPVLRFNGETGDFEFADMGSHVWEMRGHDTVTVLESSDFAITFVLGGFDVGFKGVATFSCIMSESVATVPFTISPGSDGEFVNDINVAIKQAASDHLIPHDWRVE